MTLQYRNFFQGRAEDRKRRMLNRFLRKSWQRGRCHVTRLQKRQGNEVLKRKRFGMRKRK